jgi:hypothetical protein
MKRLFMYGLVPLMILGLVSAALAGEVAQGKCISYEKEKKVIVIEEYDLNFGKDHPYGRPTGVQSTYDVSTAQVGIAPQPGDILRIAFDAKGTQKIAVKVMNVSKQDLRKK